MRSWNSTTLMLFGPRTGPPVGSASDSSVTLNVLISACCHPWSQCTANACLFARSLLVSLTICPHSSPCPKLFPVSQTQHTSVARLRTLSRGAFHHVLDCASVLACHPATNADSLGVCWQSMPNIAQQTCSLHSTVGWDARQDSSHARSLTDGAAHSPRPALPGLQPTEY